VASAPVGEPITLDHLSAHWRIALATAQQSLAALGHCGKSLTFPDQELRERLTRLELERRALAVLLEELAHDEHVHLRHHLAAPPATRQMLGIPTEIEACLFDLDGVLTPSGELHAEAWRVAFDELLSRRVDRTGERFAPFHPFDPRVDYYAHLHGRPRVEGVHTFLASRGIRLPTGAPSDRAGAETVHGLANRKNEVLQEEIERQGVAAYDGSMWFLEVAREAGVHTAVVSASANTRLLLDRAGLGDLVGVVVDGRMIAAKELEGKPAPDTVLTACELLGVAPAATAVFETTVDGIHAAHTAGIGLVVAVDRAARASILQAAGADLVVPDLDALLDRALTQ
jgi:HAD superfamily hydrolase (TIGR01509 family)